MARKKRKTDEVVEVVYGRCCGMDIHKDGIVACLNIDGKREVREYTTMTDDLLLLANWLKSSNVEMVAMESTGSYWKPIFNILECEDVPAMLVNAQHVKTLSGTKTDRRDAKWLSGLLRHGLLKPSFVPTRNMRELRELIKYRISLTEESTRVLNRMEKVLQGANIKLSSVISKTGTKTELSIIKALSEGIYDPRILSEMARGTLKNKKAELARSLNGLMGEHQKTLLKSMHNHLERLNEEIASIESEIDKRMEKDNEVLERLEEIPGVGKTTAQVILAEIGTDMEQFPNEKNLASWAGVCPGQNDSAGKRKSGRTRKGNSTLKKTLVQCANSASRAKDSYLSTQYKRIAARRGRKRANVALAHTILVICYFMIRDGASYTDLGGDYFDKRNKTNLVHRSIKRLESLGYDVVIREKVADAPAHATVMGKPPDKSAKTVGVA
ncbi:MAG: IS110 family transposase [Bacteroidales bacterium]|jgi:transposase|nr:IS110 family transposase [Bacteroidales bacterium]